MPHAVSFCFLFLLRGVLVVMLCRFSSAQTDSHPPGKGHR